MVELEHLPVPKGNFTPGSECYQICLDWVEECKLLWSISFEEQSCKSKLCSHLDRENWKNTHQVNESHRGTEGRYKRAVKKVRGMDKAKIQRTGSSSKFPLLGAR